MKKGNRIYVSDQAIYHGQNMKWTEQKTGTALYEKGHVFYHSSSTKINKFFPKLTCFFDSDKKQVGYNYILILKENKVFDQYDDEVRILLTKERDGNLFDIIYIGEVKQIINYNKMISNKKGGFCPERKIIDKRIQ